MKKEKTLQLDGLDIRLVKFSPSVGMPVLAKLQNMIGGSIIKLAGGMSGKESEQAELMAGVIDDITERVGPEQLQSFIEEIVTSGFVFINGDKITHIDDLAMFEDSDPYYLALMITKELLTFSFGGFLGKFLASRDSSKAGAKNSSRKAK